MEAFTSGPAGRSAVCLIVLCVGIFGAVGVAYGDPDSPDDDVVVPVLDPNGTPDAGDAAPAGAPLLDVLAASSEGGIWLDEVVVTATGNRTTAFAAPYSTSTVYLNDFEHNRQYRSTTQALGDLPGVMIQRTGNAQGSPYIRGFTGFRTLMLLDGIRLNNSVFRDGPNQYWNLVDPYTINRLELVRGPSSVLHGSDAIGGTVNAVLRRPDGYGAGVLGYGQVWTRAATAERSLTGRGEVISTFDGTLGIMVGGTYSYFGDVQAGGGYGRQDHTGYTVPSGDVRLEWWLNQNTVLTIAHYMLYQDDAWRTHKTIYGQSWHGTTVGNELRRVLDQYHQLTYARLESTDIGGWVDSMALTFSYQRLTETRERVRDDMRRDRQGFAVNTFGFDGRFVSPTPIGRFTYGFEWYHDQVTSFSRSYNADGTPRSMGIQGPVGDDARYDLMGLYVQNEIPIADRVDVIVGGRYTYADAYAGSVQDPNTGNRTSVSGDWDQLTGSARVSWMLDEAEHWNLYAGISQGFRAPNLSDLSRLDTARSNEIETAAPGLEPENYTAYEIGLKTQYDNVAASACYYYTDIQDMIIRTPTGNIIDGDEEVTKQNAGDGYVQGVELAGSWRFHPQLTAFGHFTWEYGEVTQYPTSDPVTRDEPLSRLMPPTGQVGLRWDHPTQPLWVEALCTLAGRADHLSTRDQGDTQRIPPDGTPGYVVFDLHAGYQVTEDLDIWASLENVTNESYRIHGSGVNEPGINFVFGLRWRF